MREYKGSVISTFPIDNSFFDTYVKRIYVMPIEIRYCSICGNQLIPSTVTIPISAFEGVHVLGQRCSDCKSFFTGHTNIIDYLENEKSEILNYKGISIRHNIEDNINRSTAAIIRKTPDFSTKSTVYVYFGRIMCHQKHHVDEYQGTIKSLDKNMSFFIEYCHECGKFLMKYADYDTYLKKYHFVPFKLKVIDDNHGFSYYDRSEYSPLSLCGYSVDKKYNLSDEQRQARLDYIIDHGILTKREVLNYLELFINTNGKKSALRTAIQKWRRDRDHVLMHKLSEQPLVEIAKIERRQPIRS